MFNQSEMMLHFVVGEDISEFMVDELCLIVGNHRVRNAETGENISPDKLPGLCHDDCR